MFECYYLKLSGNDPHAGELLGRMDGGLFCAGMIAQNFRNNMIFFRNNWSDCIDLSCRHGKPHLWCRIEMERTVWFRIEAAPNLVTCRTIGAKISNVLQTVFGTSSLSSNTCDKWSDQDITKLRISKFETCHELQRKKFIVVEKLLTKRVWISLDRF